MLRTTVDFQILKKFFESQPQPIPECNEYLNDRWNSFWSFLKNGSDVCIVNYRDEIESTFLTALTSGRGDSKIEIDEDFKKPHNCKFPKSTEVRETFFLCEELEADRKKYESNNGNLIAFLDNYLRTYEKLAFLKRPQIYSIRKNVEVPFKGWKDFRNFLIPFTDVVLIDNYLFSDPSLIHSNFVKLLLEIDASTPVKYNLLIITSQDKYGRIDITGISILLEQIKIDYKLKFNSSIILSKYHSIEHDRNIFFNYMRIKSGDSFNYFSSNGDIC